MSLLLRIHGGRFTYSLNVLQAKGRSLKSADSGNSLCVHKRVRQKACRQAVRAPQLLLLVLVDGRAVVERRQATLKRNTAGLTSIEAL